ncbi:hypothetical protein [Salinibacterium sp. ZJ454]|uniref:hypothetical protein n=1 Tax=Salinibacterium sp. ZJ454 TaxID=2708339 RepID=UPI001420B90C|nr:hypothetical protein [Salinibacterium sp. ZJ454]
MRRHLVLGFLILGALAITGCATGVEQANDREKDSSSDVSWDPIIVPKSACDDTAVAAEVEAALASPTEGPHNGMLGTPDEVPGDDRAQQEQQAKAWRELTPERRAFQLCLRLSQNGPSLDQR